MNSHWLVRFGQPAVPLALVTYTHGLGGLWVPSRKKSTTRHGKLVGNNSSIPAFVDHSLKPWISIAM